MLFRSMQKNIALLSTRESRRDREAVFVKALEIEATLDKIQKGIIFNRPVLYDFTGDGIIEQQSLSRESQTGTGFF